MNPTETLELTKAALSQSRPDIVQRTVTTSGFLSPSSATVGLQGYSLEAPAKTLYPVLTPLRNLIPRVTGGFGIQANWRAITAINSTNMRAGVAEGKRGGIISHTTNEYLAAFRGFGLEDFVNFEAEYAAKGFDEPRARAVEGLLRSLMIAEEQCDLGGNTSLTLTKPVVTATQNTDSTSTVTNDAAKSFICVALGYNAYFALAGYNNGQVGQALSLTTDPGTIATFTKTNAGGTSDTYNGGTSIKSDAANCTIDAAHKSASVSVVPVKGAYGYAWYWGASGSEYLGAITTLAGIQVTADASTTTVVHANLAADHSSVSLEYDGLLTIANTTSSGAYIKQLANGVIGTGTKLTTDGAGGISQFNDMFADRWNLYRLSIDKMYLSGQDLLNVNAIVIANGGAPLIRYNMDQGGATLDAGVAVATILNKITNTKVQLMVHPNLPQGTIIGLCTQLPYKLSGVTDVMRKLCRQDYYELEWPITSRRWEYGVYFDGVLQHYFPPALAVITNIPNLT